MGMNGMKKVIGVGSPIVDMLAQVSEEFVGSIPGDKGGMVLVDRDGMAGLVSRLEEPPLRAPGGSAANTIVAMARMGVPAAFLGKVGEDEDSRYYLDAFAAAGGDTSRFKRTPEEPTARCLSLVTPDSERTMRTNLGAAMLMEPAEVSAADFAGCDHAHIEGYLLYNRPLTEAVLRAAKAAGCTVSLDLGSFEVVGLSKDVLPALLEEYVDAVFANEDEARAFPGGDTPERALDALAACCGTAVVKLGPQGALLRRGGETVRASIVPADAVVDTTGAGDCWAAGFLYGWLQDWDLARCGRLGAVLGSETVRQMGAVPASADAWARISAACRG